MSVYNTTFYFIYIKIVYYQGDMFRPSLVFEGLKMTQ